MWENNQLGVDGVKAEAASDLAFKRGIRLSLFDEAPSFCISRCNLWQNAALLPRPD
jgi:hypothetical protein